MKRVLVITSVAFVILGLANLTFAALITYDLRANPTQGDPDVTVINDHLVQVTGPSDIVSMTMYARLTGVTDTATSGVRSVPVAVASGYDYVHPQPLLLGHIENVALASPYGSGTGATTGASADLDGDTDLDRGSNMNTYAKPTTWMYATNGALYYGESDSEVALFTLDFHVSYSPDVDSTILDVYPYATSSTAAGGSLHQFRINGSNYALGNKTGAPGTTPAWTPTTLNAVGIYTMGVEIYQVPEPAALILLGMGCLALLLFWRRR